MTQKADFYGSHEDGHKILDWIDKSLNNEKEKLTQWEYNKLKVFYHGVVYYHVLEIFGEWDRFAIEEGIQ